MADLTKMVNAIDRINRSLGGAPKPKMRRDGYNHARGLHKTMLDAMARAMFVSAWAERQEERGKLLHGDIMDLAPRTSAEAKRAALRLEGRFEQLNPGGLSALLYMAAKADGMDPYTDNTVIATEYAQEFGHYLAMQALGSGVSWFDSHARFEMNFPHIEFYL